VRTESILQDVNFSDIDPRDFIELNSYCNVWLSIINHFRRFIFIINPADRIINDYVINNIIIPYHGTNIIEPGTSSIVFPIPRSYDYPIVFYHSIHDVSFPPLKRMKFS